jgi:hypothetical protein
VPGEASPGVVAPEPMGGAVSVGFVGLVTASVAAAPGFGPGVAGVGRFGDGVCARAAPVPSPRHTNPIKAARIKPLP